MRNKHLPYLTIIASTLFAIAFPYHAIAKQTSLDTRIIEAFKDVDERTIDHEKNSRAIRNELDGLAKKMKELRKKMAAASDGEGKSGNWARRKELHARLISVSADYLSKSFRMINSAAEVISANIEDIAKLSDAVRNSPDAKNKALRLKDRVGKNIQMGRSMHNNLVQLRSWARNNPDMVNKFKSLKRLMQTLDNRISIDQARLKSRHVDATGAIKDRRQEALARTIDRLSDMYVEVESEREALKDLRDELEIAIQLGRLEMTKELTSRAVPRIPGMKATESGVNLQEMANIIGDLNNKMLEDDTVPEAATAPEGDPKVDAGQPDHLKIGGFKNF